jgi:hypothetical protein
VELTCLQCTYSNQATWCLTVQPASRQLATNGNSTFWLTCQALLTAANANQHQIVQVNL